ncbi:hypothetical protein LSAT2_029186 [Lamellibrachia satsuma]|nr:hypothetical protein LSAT2_029186 [Lamellibrachia satsuma]
MERDGAPESSRDVGDAGDSLLEEWRVLDEWSEHSKDEELEEGEIVDSDTDGDTRNPRNVRPSEVPSGIGVVNQGPWTVVEDICRKTTRSLLKMAETTAFSGSEDGEIVEVENLLNCEQSSYKITSRNSVGSAAVSCLVGGATGTVSSSGFRVGRGQEQLPARPDSGNQGLSSKGKVDGHKTFAKNQMDSTVDGNDDLVINMPRGDVQPIESAAQTKVSADKFTDTTPETFDIQTTLVENGAVVLSPTVP